MQTGSINVQTENIFPIIKKFLYSDHEIFLRELVSNAVDATQKLKALSSLGEFKGELGELRVEVSIDKKAGTITISDRGIGMTDEEVDKYINQIAFSGAEEFVEEYKDKDVNALIGHFGLGFYSSFMVSDLVEIQTLSHKDGATPVKWSCDGSPNFKITKGKRKDRGTDIILQIADDSKEFLEDARIHGILNKYCKFLPVDIKFGEREEKDGEGEDAPTVMKDVIINNTSPAWTKRPADLNEEDYKNFYRELYPMAEDALFHIHLNVDHPFNLTGILYFPKLKNNIEVQKNKIQLYSNQVFITDSVEDIVPEFLTLLHGVIDSPDIPLNVSRSYLQSDHNVKKISNHIMKKVADKLEEMFKKDREDFEKKWNDIKVFIEYGMLTEDKFKERSSKFGLYQNIKGEYYTFEEYTKKIKAAQTDKDDRLVYLYAHDAKEQHAYIAEAERAGYDVLLMDTPLTPHVVQKLEMDNEKTSFARVDADTIDKLIKKDADMPSKLSEEEKEKLKPVFEGVVDKERFTVEMEPMSEEASPVVITQSEFMRRMKEQQMTGGGNMMFGQMPEMYNLVVNTNHPLITAILETKTEKKKERLTKQAIDLAMLGQGMLKGEELTAFIKRSVELIK